MQVVFSLSQLQYFQFSTVVKLYKKNKETQKFCPLAPIFHLAPYLILTATLQSIIQESLVLVTKNEQFGVKSAHIRTTKNSIAKALMHSSGFIEYSTVRF